MKTGSNTVERASAPKLQPVDRLLRIGGAARRPQMEQPAKHSLATPQVALLIETSNAYARGLLKGIVSYIREHRPWSLYLAENRRGDAPPDWLPGWKGDGIIARVENPSIAQMLSGLKVPIVDVSSARLIPALPWFETDDVVIARLAGEHLLERGFKNFGFCGDAQFNWSKWRCEHFVKFIQSAGCECSIYEPSKKFSLRSEGQVEDIADWLRPLPKPLGVMACYDLRGVQVLDACRRLGVAVPEEVAVIGVDNDELLCELSSPPLSSVIPNTHRTGFEAAALLDKLMAGSAHGKWKIENGKADNEARNAGQRGDVTGQTYLIPPIGVTTRQSTDVLAIEDRNVAKALHYIREHACDGINVKDVLKAVPHSRRLLEGRFKKLIGRTPHDEILRVQLNRVKQLLIETDLSLEEIAERAGFAHVEYLSVVFKKKIGLPPSKYRLVHRP